MWVYEYLTSAEIDVEEYSIKKKIKLTFYQRGLGLNSEQVPQLTQLPDSSPEI